MIPTAFPYISLRLTGLWLVGWLGIAVPVLAQGGGSIADSVHTFMIEENLNKFLGFGITIVEKVEEDYTFTHGYQTANELHEFTDSTIFNLGSVSKLFTAISVAKLADQGLIGLNDPVFQHYPEFLDIQGKSQLAPQVTIMQLLQHRSGITQSMEHLYPEKFDKEVLDSEDQYYQNTLNYRSFMSREDFRNRFALHARIEHKPGKRYSFSNLGYVILGYIVEEVTGMNLGQFVSNQIFVPLEMDDSHYYLTPDEQVPRLAYGYYRLTDGSYLNVHQNEIESPSPTGDGGIKTTLRDMKKFLKFILGDYRKDVYSDIIPRPVLLSMIRPSAKGPDKSTWVGLGFHNLQPWNFTGHTGGWDGFLSILYYHPESNSAIFMVTNREDNELFLFLRVFAAYAMLYRDFR